MDRRMADALDRHITGNYGEDQYRDEPPCVDCPLGYGPADEDNPCPVKENLELCPTYGKYTCGECKKPGPDLRGNVPRHRRLMGAWDEIFACSDECAAALLPKIEKEIRDHMTGDE